MFLYISDKYDIIYSLYDHALKNAPLPLPVLFSSSIFLSIPLLFSTSIFCPFLGQTYFLSLIDSDFNKSSIYENFLCDCLPSQKILATTLHFEQNLSLGETKRTSFSNLFTEQNLTSSDLFPVQRKIMPSTSEPSNLYISLSPIPQMIPKTPQQIET